MSTAVARIATPAHHDWMSAYVEHCHRLGCSDRALQDRLRSARAFLGAHPDLAAWMALPTADRVAAPAPGRCWSS